jgi:TPR repeat protein
MYMLGLGGLKPDKAQAAALFQSSADLGSPTGMIGLGMMYTFGEAGFPVDKAKGTALFKRAADKGDASAMSLMGTMYEKGWGVPKDQGKAQALKRQAFDIDPDAFDRNRDLAR